MNYPARGVLSFFCPRYATNSSVHLYHTGAIVAAIALTKNGHLIFTRYDTGDVVCSAVAIPATGANICVYYGGPTDYLVVNDACASTEVRLTEPLIFDDIGATGVEVTPRPTLSGQKAKLICLTPVHNEEERLQKFLDYLAYLKVPALLLDDGSTDTTRDIAYAHPSVLRVLEKPATTLWLDGPSRLRLLHEAQEYEPDWCLYLDTDERLDNRAISLLPKLMGTPYDKIMARVFHMWDSRRAYKCDAPYEGPQIRVLLYRNISGTYVYPEALHRVVLRPIGIVRSGVTSLRIKHYGSLSREVRQRRFNNYTVQDKSCKFNKYGYLHLISYAKVSMWRESRPYEYVGSGIKFIL